MNYNLRSARCRLNRAAIGSSSASRPRLQLPIATMSTETPHHRLWIWGKWIDTENRVAIVDPYTKQQAASVALADAAAIDDAVAAAHAAFEITRRLAPFERSAMLAGAADGIARRAEQFAKTIVAEAAKPIVLAETEVARAVATLTVAAEEARRFGGEVLDIDAYPAGRGHFGLMRRFPV